MVEGANINKSLLALGNCINALCESAGATRHVPYRNSKLTRLLKFSLGGNCKTVMIVCVAPASNHYDDTHNTLLYADRASKIKTKVVTRNVVNVERHVGQYVEAINRLNLEVAELKAKLAGKLGNEAEVSRRRREEAKAEVERSREDMRQKAAQAQSTIIGGVVCESKLAVSRIKQQTLTSRLALLKSQPEWESSADILAEQAFLNTLVSSEAALFEPSSQLAFQLSRSRNADNMFEAMLRAVTERRSHKLEEVDIENIKLEAQFQRSEIARKKSDAMQEALKLALSSQMDVNAHVCGILVRCTAMLKSGNFALQCRADGINEATPSTLGDMAKSLKTFAESNDAALRSIMGETAEKTFYEGSSRLSFTGYDPISIISPPAQSTENQTKTRGSRRMSNGGAGTASAINRRIHRTPRKSMRPSLAANHLYGRRATLDKPAEKKKGVQWKDEAGKGSLDDRSFTATLSISTFRSESPRISEGDWEDERTEDSSSSSFVTSIPNASSAAGTRRLGRLDPSFLKSRNGSISLSSLPEKDESGINISAGPSKPFLDRSNQIQAPTTFDSNAGDSNMTDLQATKGKGRESPLRRLPSTLKVPGSIGKRRRSNIGPVRSEKVRRRSSLLPSPLPERDREIENSRESLKNGPQRVPIVRTPSKRPKRLSMSGSAARSGSSARSSLLYRGSTSYSDANTSNDSSSRISRPTWR